MYAQVSVRSISLLSTYCSGSATGMVFDMGVSWFFVPLREIIVRKFNLSGGLRSAYVAVGVSLRQNMSLAK